MCLFRFETIDDSLLRLLNQIELVHLLVLIFDSQIELFNCCLRIEILSFDVLVSSHFLIVLNL